MQRELFPQSPSERFLLFKLKENFFGKLYIASKSIGKTQHLYKRTTTFETQLFRSGLTKGS